MIKVLEALWSFVFMGGGSMLIGDWLDDVRCDMIGIVCCNATGIICNSQKGLGFFLLWFSAGYYSLSVSADLGPWT